MGGSELGSLSPEPSRAWSNSEINGRIVAQEMDRSLETLESILSQESTRVAASLSNLRFKVRLGYDAAASGFLKEVARLLPAFSMFT